MATKKIVKKVVEVEPLEEDGYDEDEEGVFEEEDPVAVKKTVKKAVNFEKRVRKPREPEEWEVQHEEFEQEQRRKKNVRRPAPRANKNGHISLPWNDLVVSGNLGKDPEFSYTQRGSPVTKFSLAVYNGKNKETGKPYPPVWMKAVSFDQDIFDEANDNLASGTHVELKGRLSQSVYEGKYYTSIQFDWMKVGWD